MYLFTRIIPTFLNSSSRPGAKLISSSSNFHSLVSTVQKVPYKQDSITPGGLYSLLSRSIVRNHFPRPSETKRIKRHGWFKRMSSPTGRRVLMNRILKGRWVYSH